MPKKLIQPFKSNSVQNCPLQKAEILTTSLKITTICHCVCSNKVHPLPLWMKTILYFYLWVVHHVWFTASDTSSCMPVSSSIITQASMGRAISLLVRFRCSSRAVPNAGFSVHLSVRWWDEVRMIWVMATLHYIWKHLRIITKWVCGAQIQEDLQCETGYITVLFTGREREKEKECFIAWWQARSLGESQKTCQKHVWVYHNSLY